MRLWIVVQPVSCEMSRFMAEDLRELLLRSIAEIGSNLDSPFSRMAPAPGPPKTGIED